MENIYEQQLLALRTERDNLVLENERLKDQRNRSKDVLHLKKLEAEIDQLRGVLAAIDVPPHDPKFPELDKDHLIKICIMQNIELGELRQRIADAHCWTGRVPAVSVPELVLALKSQLCQEGCDIDGAESCCKPEIRQLYQQLSASPAPEKQTRSQLPEGVTRVNDVSTGCTSPAPEASKISRDERVNVRMTGEQLAYLWLMLRHSPMSINLTALQELLEHIRTEVLCKTIRGRNLLSWSDWVKEPVKHRREIEALLTDLFSPAPDSEGGE